MIRPRLRRTAATTADHYDELDPVYRRLWGEHVHHGLWTSGRESPAQAVEALSDMVADRLALAPGQRLVDIGCGYGATARRFALHHGVEVTGFTVSARQAEKAAADALPAAVLHRDWLDNRLPAAVFDGAYAIESSEHMEHKSAFFVEAHRVLRRGGRLVVCAWLARADATPWQVRHLLEPICREGSLPSMGTRAEYEAMAADAGFALLGYDDLSAQVARTWTICLRRFLAAFVIDRETRRLALAARNRAFALTVPRLILAYRTGAMRYGVFVWEKR